MESSGLPPLAISRCHFRPKLRRQHEASDPVRLAAMGGKGDKFRRMDGVGGVVQGSRQAPAPEEPLMAIDIQAHFNLIECAD